MISVESIFNKFLIKGRKKEKIKERKKNKNTQSFDCNVRLGMFLDVVKFDEI